MQELTAADAIWNRACYGEAAFSHPGDRALSVLLRFHGLAMNGGVLHALQCVDKPALEAARSGYRFFGFHEVADLLDEAAAAADADDESYQDRLERELDARYNAFIPNDTAILDRFECALRSDPGAFADL